MGMTDDVAAMIAGTKPANKSGRFVPKGVHTTLLDAAKSIEIRKKGSQTQMESAVVLEFKMLESDNDEVTIGEIYTIMYCLERNDYAVKNLHRDLKNIAGTTEDFTVEDMTRVLDKEQILAGCKIKIFGTMRTAKESGNEYTVYDFDLIEEAKE